MLENYVQDEDRVQAILEDIHMRAMAGQFEYLLWWMKRDDEKRWRDICDYCAGRQMKKLLPN